MRVLPLTTVKDAAGVPLKVTVTVDRPPPERLTVAPGLAAAGVTWARVGEVATVKGVAEKPKPKQLEILTGPEAAPAGTTAVMRLSLTKVKEAGHRRRSRCWRR